MNKSGHKGIDHDEIIRLHNGSDARCDGKPWGYRKIAAEVGCSAQNARRHCLAEAVKEETNSKCGLIESLKKLEQQEILNLPHNELVDMFSFDEKEHTDIIGYLNQAYPETSITVRIGLIKSYMPTLRKNASDENFLKGYAEVRKIVNGE